MFIKLKKMISLDNPFRLLYHKFRAITANIVYGFPSKKMVIIWVTWTNWKTSTCNIIAKWLRNAGKKVFMFSTLNYIIWDEEYSNNIKMTSPDAFYLQKLFKKAKDADCEYAVIETASHWIKMNRIWGINYDIVVLTNITRDHLDLHKTMEDYVNTKLQIFKNLMYYDRKPNIKKTAIINMDSEYKELFMNETYDSRITYSIDSSSDMEISDLKIDYEKTSFRLDIPWYHLNINTKLRGIFNVYNIMASVWVFVSLWISIKDIERTVAEIDFIPWRMEEVENDRNMKIFVDYAHTPDAIEKVILTATELKNSWKIITVFWATWDRDSTKRPIMWKIVSNLSDIVILTQDDDYTEDTNEIIKDVLTWIERKQWEDFWIVPDRKSAIRTALLKANSKDIILLLWKWDEHVMMTNAWPIKWHDKTVLQELLSEINWIGEEVDFKG